ncbi:MAG TPA: glycosyltransferase family 39 protein [Candidatus Sulfotelmatobacter sp.]|nr:glycosyltransferase family 39 protein [Candidatus Sulfotelmatobacter sp.]
MNLQELIHYIEVGAGKRYLGFLIPVVLVLAVAVLYDFRAWKNLSAPEAMDAAQLARNIATGHGYTTLFIRPLSLYIVQADNQGKMNVPSFDGVPDYARIKTPHPDLANPPVYPIVLAGLMKIAPFNYAVNFKSGFWAINGYFARYQPDFIITIFNQLLFLVAAVVTYFIAAKLFDAGVAGLTVILLLGCQLLWNFSASGLSTMLLILIFLALFWCVLKIEEEAHEPDTVRLLSWSVFAGLLTGVGALTRYAFGWTIIPVALFLVLFSGPKKLLNMAAALAAFAVVLGPWIARNAAISGTPFGTAGYALFDGTDISPQIPLERSLHPDMLEALWQPSMYWHKFATNALPLFEGGLLKIAGTWPSLLFFSGLMLAFNRPAPRRTRYFLLMCLGTFIAVQALGKTWLSDVSPEVNSENLLVLTAPLLIIFGAAFFSILLDQMKFPARELRYIAAGIFVLLSSLPLISALWFKSFPASFPPYYPPDIERVAGWMKENELIMSDIPWAVAWYGNHQSVWLTDNAQNSFFELNDYMKPVSALYLSRLTTNSRLVTDCIFTGTNSWGNFVMNAVANQKLPKDFPLRRAPSGSATIESGMFLTDVDRWKLQ